MTIAREQLVQSLIDIVETNDTDAYLLDTNVIGANFFFIDHSYLFS